MGMYIHVPIPLAIIGSMRIVYLFTYRRGLRRCSFRRLSNARAIECETGNRTDSHAFSLYMPLIKNVCSVRRVAEPFERNNFINSKTYYKDEKESIYYGGFRSRC